MKIRFPSLFFVIYRRLTVAVSFGRFFRRGWLGVVLSWAFASIIALRRKLFHFQPIRLPSTVVSIGNIVLGGSGKTPTVLWLAKTLQAQGYSCAVLSRGYKGRRNRKELVIVDPRVHNAAYVGDEPLLMANTLLPGSIFVHADRRIAAKQAARHFDILILDDGFQNARVHKDVEVVVVNGQDPLGGEAFFPKGRLRDSLSRLKDADFVLVNGACSDENQKKLHSLSDASKIFVEPRISEIIWESNAEELGRKDLRDLGVGVFCGIGFPQGFLSMLRKAGIKILGSYVLPDHTGITEREYRYFNAKMKMRQAQGILCTEKDRVKLGAWIHDPHFLPLGSVQTVFSFPQGEETTLLLLNKICQIHNSKR